MISLWDKFSTFHAPLPVGYQVGLLRSASPNTGQYMARASCEYHPQPARSLGHHFGSRRNFGRLVVKSTHELILVRELNHS